MFDTGIDKSGNISNEGHQRVLPPGIGSTKTFGNLFIQMGNLKWLTYDGQNYLEDYGKGMKVQDLYSHIKFWGEDPNKPGIYLKFANGLKSNHETAVVHYKYNINCPEPSFENYIDDMGALIVDFYNPKEGLTIATSKVIVKLYLKRLKRHDDMSPLVELRGVFPITLVGDENVKIGEFELAITSSF